MTSPSKRSASYLAGRYQLQVLSVGLAMLTVLQPVAAQDAEALVRQGVELRREGRDVEALATFEHAQRLAPSARTRAQIALAQQALGRWADAESGLREALDASDPWVERNRGPLKAALERVQDELGTLFVDSELTGAMVRVNGTDVGRVPLAAALRVPAGSVRLEAISEGQEIGSNEGQVAPRGELRLRLARDASAPLTAAQASKPYAASADASTRGSSLGGVPPAAVSGSNPSDAKPPLSAASSTRGASGSHSTVESGTQPPLSAAGGVAGARGAQSTVESGTQPPLSAAGGTHDSSGAQSTVETGARSTPLSAAGGTRASSGAQSAVETGPRSTPPSAADGTRDSSGAQSTVDTWALSPLSAASTPAPGGESQLQPSAAGSTRASDVDTTRPLRLVGWGLLAGAGVGVATGVIGHVIRNASASHYNDDSQCVYGSLSREQRCARYRDRADTAELVAIAGYAAGAALLSGAIAVWLWPEPAATHVASVDARIGPGSAYLAAELKF